MQNSQPVNIPLLSFDEDPGLSLFYILSERRKNTSEITNRVWPGGEPANGIAFIVNSSGLLVTAAHVLWVHHIFPGDTIDIFGASPKLPIRAKAVVLEEGWKGLLLNENGELPSNPLDTRYVDRRAASLKEDCAFLQLDLNSFDVDQIRGHKVTVSSPKHIAEMFRVMPLGCPCYPSSGAELKAWWVLKRQGVPELVSGNASFNALEPSLYGAFSMKSEDLKSGFSGSPLWDSKRRLTVGFVRRSVSDLMPSLTLATDIRALEQDNIVIGFDSQLTPVIRACEYLVNFSSPRHKEITYSLIKDIFVEPRAGLLKPEINLNIEERKTATPAINLLYQLLSANNMVCICSGAGTGKSTLVRELARRILINPFAIIRKSRFIPLILNASDFPNSHFNLENLLGIASKTLPFEVPDPSNLLYALEVNDAKLLVIVDGLDEIGSVAISTLLSKLHGLHANSNVIAGIIVATRPDSMVIAAGTNNNHNRWKMPIIELYPFDPKQVDEYAVARFNADEKLAPEFVSSLGRVDWAHDATPLQLEMAAALFSQPGGLPSRIADLVFEYIKYRVENSNYQVSALDPESWDGIYHRKEPNGEKLNLLKVFYALALTSFRKNSKEAYSINEVLSIIGSQMFFEPVAKNPREMLDFINRCASKSIGLVSLIYQEDSVELIWEHRTIMEALAAQAIIETIEYESSRLSENCCVKINKEINTHVQDHRFTLTLLAVLDRKDYVELVEKRITKAMAAPFSARNEALLALRSLAAGLRFSSDIQRKLVALLIRVTLAPNGGSSACAEIFVSSSDLPSAINILQRSELREFVAQELWQKRFRLRDPRRKGINRPLQVTTSEAKILDLLHMWNYWQESGLRLSKSEQLGSELVNLENRSFSVTSTDDISNSLTTRIIDRGGFTIIDRDGDVASIELPARVFLEGVVTAAQNLPRGLSPTQVVSLYLKAIEHKFIPNPKNRK